MRISAIQMEVGRDFQTNLETARRLIGKAATMGSRIVCLPEYFSIPPFSTMDLPMIYAQTYETTMALLRELSRVNQLCIIGGSLIRKRRDGLFFNTCPVYDNGNLLVLQDKIHVTTGERARGLTGSFTDKLHAFEVDGVKTSVAICADILFPKTISTVRDQRIKLLFVPLTSPVRDRDLTQKNRDCLFVARAFDNNVYVIKTGSVGRSVSGEKVAGRSLVAGPQGVLLKAKSEWEEEVLMVDLDLIYLKKMDLISQLFDSP